MKKTIGEWWLLAAIALLCFAPSGFADSLKLINGGSDVMGGVYVGPYNFTLTSGSQTSALQLICDDFSDEVFTGETWSVTSTTVGSLNNVMFLGQSQYQQKYQEVAWLVEQLGGLNPLSSTYSKDVGDIQWAVWDIFDPSASSTDPYGTIGGADLSVINSWITEASTDYAGGNYSNLIIYTPVKGSQNPLADGEPQEYFGIVPTPEPGSLAMLVIGLLALGFFAGRRKLVNGSEA